MGIQGQSQEQGKNAETDAPRAFARPAQKEKESIVSLSRSPWGGFFWPRLEQRILTPALQAKPPFKVKREFRIERM
jgi:hypothetical protein